MPNSTSRPRTRFVEEAEHRFEHLQRWRRRAAMGAAQAPAHAVEGARQPGWREERRPEDLPLPLAVGGRHGAIKTAVVPLRKARNPRKTGVCRVRQLDAWVCRHAAVRPFDL